MTVLRGTRKALTDTIDVVRILPQARHRHVGPFVFLDHFGPAPVEPYAMAVRPHPHIGLATLTVLFDGAIRHRDSLGTDVWIRPGEVNWMTSGRGIVHSERSEDYAGPMHGLQLWVALPDELEEVEPSFQHLDVADVPVLESPTHRLEVVAGTYRGHRSPLRTHSPTLLVLAEVADGSVLEIPEAEDGQERGVLIVEGTARVGSDAHGPDDLLLIGDRPVVVRAAGPLRLAILGGRPVGERHMFWNFVHSDRERIEVAKADWREKRFDPVPGDDEERIELP